MGENGSDSNTIMQNSYGFPLSENRYPLSVWVVIRDGRKATGGREMAARPGAQACPEQEQATACDDPKEL
jgi:hypothetical protein